MDKELILRAKEQDKEAFVTLLNELKPNMYKVAKAMLGKEEDIADAMQETILACWEKIHTLRKPEYFKTWLIRILINNCKAIYNQHARIIVDSAFFEEEAVEADYADVEWQEMMECLNVKQRIVVELYYVEGMKVREIAEILRIGQFEKTLQELEPKRGKIRFSWGKMAVAVAAVVVLCGMVMVSNPAMASQLPFVGNIFQKVEKDVIYSGDYSKKDTLHVSSDEEACYSGEDKGIKLTFSEVYSDGFSIYTTVKLESDKYDLTKAGLTKDGRQSINLATSFGVNCEAGPYDYDLLLDGKNQGKHAFVGMMKFDKANNSAEKGVVNVSIKNIYIELDGGEDAFIEGNWKFKIPYKTDGGKSKEIAVGKKITDGLKIEKLFVSPYQLVVFSDIAEGRLDKNAAAYAIFDQDGKVIEFQEIGDKEGGLERDIYALQGRQISEVHVYITQKERNVAKMHQVSTEEEAQKLSEKDFSINIGK